MALDRSPATLTLWRGGSLIGFLALAAESALVAVNNIRHSSKSSLGYTQESADVAKSWLSRRCCHRRQGVHAHGFDPAITQCPDTVRLGVEAPLGRVITGVWRQGW